MKFTNPLYLVLLLTSLLLSTSSFRAIEKSTKKPLSSVKKEISLDVLINSLKHTHYAPLAVDDNFSNKVFDLFLERIDFNKSYFIQSDINQLSKYKTQLDEQVMERKFAFFDEAMGILNKRIQESKSYYSQALEQKFDFDKKDYIETDAKKRDYAKSKEELKKHWFKSMKYQVLAKMVDLETKQEKAHEKSDTVKLKRPSELLAEAIKKVKKSNDDYFRRLERVNESDRFNGYLNCIANVHDPHTGYFPPKDKKNFDIGMSGQLEGIGAQLQEKDGYIKVSNIIPGSASYRQGQLKAGHIITKVAQGDKEPVSVVDMRLDEAVELIRGKKGTEVRLTVEDEDGSTMVIPIIRDVVILEETYAKSLLIESDKKIGYIRLPKFYANFNKSKTGRSCAEDVKAELDKLIEENIEGVILDLRNNGGGSLQDAVKIAGLFIEDGPVVQIRSKSGFSSVLKDKDASTKYGGPLVVLVNYNSASASEIVAAALQDYNRGVIVGSPSTFGKGTVQRFIELDRFVAPSFDTLKPIGALKVTMQKFYRVNGGSTQLKGVTPDIVLPDLWSKIDVGEKEHDFPIDWDEIEASAYKDYSPSNFKVANLRDKSGRRIEQSEAFKKINERSDLIKSIRENSNISLRKEDFKRKKEEQKKAKKDFESLLDKELSSMKIQNLSVDLAKLESDTTKLKLNNEWKENLGKDIVLEESVMILQDCFYDSIGK